MLRIILSCIVAGAVSTFAISAAAAESFSVNPFGALLEAAELSDGSFGNSGIIMPATEQSSFAFGFVLPRDYRSNTKVRIKLSWRTPGTDCDIVLRPNFVDRTRHGHPQSSGFASGGLAASDGSNALLVPNVPGQGNRKTYSLEAAQGFAEQLPGDAINLGFFRRPSDPGDTCLDDLIISGIEIVYRKR